MRVEHDFEPVPGLPGALPPGERVLWRGAPSWTGVARRAFLARPVAIYFAVLMLWRGGAAWNDGASLLEALGAATSLAPVALAALGVIAGLAYATAKATIYTITTDRVVLRFGVALTMCVNVPFSVIRAASVKLDGRGRADIPLEIAGRDRFSYLLLWPYARPWRFARPEPMLRSVADGEAVAKILSSALAEAQARRIEAGLSEVGDDQIGVEAARPPSRPHPIAPAPAAGPVTAAGVAAASRSPSR